MTVTAMSLASMLCFLSIVHLYWTVRGVGIGAAVPTQTNGTPVFRPGRAAAFARWDSMLFTPLCAGMSIAAVLVAIFAA